MLPSQMTPGPDHAAPHQPEPVLAAAKLGGLLSALLVAVGGVVALFVGGLTLDELGPLGTGIGAAVTAAVAVAVYVIQVWQGLKARKQVTPTTSPRSDAGVPLTEVQ